MTDADCAGRVHHIPVLLAEVLQLLQLAEGSVIVDGCFGGGGYSRAFLAAGASVVAFDRDPVAVFSGAELERESGGRLRIFNECFSRMNQYVDSADAVVLDIGVSSHQIDSTERGFSFQRDGPLDMRMSSSGLSAADLVNNWPVSNLARIFKDFGEERHARSIARIIDQRRRQKPFESTLDLAKLIAGHLGRGKNEKLHPATRVFQALRICVNDELSELSRGLIAAECLLKPGGLLLVVSFHSLEDRIVKRFITERSQPPLVSRHMPVPLEKALTFKKHGPLVFPSEEEIRLNPRARSARLRCAQRLGFNLPDNGHSVDLFSGG